MGKIVLASLAAAALATSMLIPVADAAEGSIAMVVANPSSLTAGEDVVAGRWAATGFTVAQLDDDTVTSAAVTNASLIFVSQSASSNAAAVRSLTNVAVPVWIAKPYLLDDFGFTGSVAGTDYGDKAATTFTIVEPGHPIAGGVTGTVTFQGAGRVSWGRPTAAATTVATTTGSASVIALDTGDQRANGSPAPSCRLTFPVYGNAPTTWTATGWTLFDNATIWATACGDDLPPRVSITSPSDGSTVSGSASLSASASDDVAVASVAFSVDGGPLFADANGADGWQTSWDSTSVSNGNHTLTATATDSAGKQASSSIIVQVTNQLSTPGSVVMVVANPAALTTGETRVSQRWEPAGFIVSRADDDVVTAAAVTDASLVFVSQSASSNAAAVKSLGNAPVAVWVARPYLFDDFGLTRSVAGTDYGDKPGNTLTIEASGHPIAGGATGTVTFQGSGTRVSWLRPTAAASTVATTTGSASVVALDKGAARSNGSAAPSCRLTFPVYGNAPTSWTAVGWTLFDNATAWAVQCADGPPPPPSGDDVDQVVLISVDGLNPQAITQLGVSGAATFHRLMMEGASTLNARTLFEATQTLPNHTSMFSGRRVTLPGGHGVTFNEDNGGTVHGTAGNYVDGIFSLVHDNGGSTAMYAGKEKFDFLDRSWDGISGAPDTTGLDTGRDKIDVYERANEATSTSRLIARLQSAAPTFSFLHLAKPDSAGHAYGFMSPQYIEAVAETDAWIGQVLEAITTDPDLNGTTTVILTTDHGGTGTIHSDATLPANYTVPFFAWGATVEPGANLYAVNSDRADPGAGRPDYAPAVQPIRNAEAGNLATALLGLPPIPNSQINNNQSLDISLN